MIYLHFRGRPSLGDGLVRLSLGSHVQRGPSLRGRVVQRQDRLRNACHDLRQKRGGLRVQDEEEAQDRRLGGSQLSKKGLKVSQQYEAEDKNRWPNL